MVFGNFCDLLIKNCAGFHDLGSILAPHDKKQVMPVPRTTTAIESVVITFFLLVASACIPLILYISQQETQGHKERVEELAAAAASRVAEAAIRIRRQLAEGRTDNDASRKRRRLSSRFSMSEQGNALKLIISHQLPSLTTGNLNELFDKRNNRGTSFSNLCKN